MVVLLVELDWVELGLVEPDLVEQEPEILSMRFVEVVHEENQLDSSFLLPFSSFLKIGSIFI